MDRKQDYHADAVAPLHALALCAPNALDALSDEEVALLACDPTLWLRPEQRVPRGSWRSCGYLTGRGWGKTLGIAAEIHRRVYAGESIAPALVAPTLERVTEVQVSALLATSSPWCRCVPYRAGVRWANGVVAEGLSADVERPASGSNYDLAWMTEIVRWAPNTRRKAFDDVTTACRVGNHPQYLWDTTSSGKNDVVLFLIEQHERDPDAHRIVRGTIFDNPVLTKRYVLDEIAKYQRGTRRYDEEILGLAFAEAAGALWRDEWIVAHRVHEWPIDCSVIVLGLDPALSGDPTADEVGLVKAGRAGARYFVEDFSQRMGPEEYAKRVVHECKHGGAAGVIVERNHVGQHARDLIRVHARLADMRFEVLPDANRAFPERRHSVIFVREVVSRESKEVRGAPVAALYAAGLVSHVGVLARLEHQQTTWEPGVSRSPNRIDACVFAIGELAGVTSERRAPDATIEAGSRAAKQLRANAGRPRRIAGT